MDVLEVEAAAEDSMAIPEQETNNAKKKYVFMTAQLANGWIVSN